MTGIRLSAVVMTHPSRRRYADQMRDVHPDLELQVVEDPAPQLAPSALRTGRLAWDAVAPDATHHLVIEDDTRLCSGFPDIVLAAIAARPDHAISLYTEWGSETSYAVRLAALAGCPWAEVVDDYVPTQALVLPARAARAFGRFPGSAGPLYDRTMHLFLATTGVPTLMTVPNLVDDARISSIEGHDHLGARASVCFVADTTASGPPPMVDWSAPAVAAPVVPAFSWTTGRAYSLRRGDTVRGPWRRTPYPVISRFEPLATATLELGRAAVSQLPARVRSIGPGLLLGLWLTGHGLGRVTADLLGSEPAALDTALARPVVERALATTAPGALRFLVADAELTRRLGHLHGLVETSVRDGYQTRSLAEEAA